MKWWLGTRTDHGFDRRWFRTPWALALAMVLLLAACGGAEGDGQQQPEAQGTADAEAGSPPADVEQVLTVGAGEDGFQAETTRPRLGMYPLNANICEGLVRMTKDFRVEAALATDWELVGDNTFRFTLREDVTFHNGEPLTAEAVKYSMDRLVEKEIDFTAFLGPDSTEVIDDHTVEITPTKPNRRLPQQIVHPTYSIVAPGTEPAEEPVCTGPFEFVEYVPNDRLSVERFDGYWGEPAKLEELTFRFIPDDTTRRLALESGEVDIIFDLPRQQLAEVEGREDMQLAKADPGAVYLSYMNLRGDPPHEILRDVQVREAVQLVFDRQQLVDQIFQGNAEVVNTINPPTVLGEHAELVEGFEYDPDRASQLLDEAGWVLGDDGIRQKDGRSLTLSVPVESQEGESEALQFLQAQAKEVGIDLQLDVVESGSAIDKLNAGEFDLNIGTPNQNDANPSFLLTLQLYGESRVPWTEYQHVGEDLDELVTASLETPDPDEARRLAAEAQSVAIDDEHAVIPFAGIFRVYPMKADVAGFDPHPSRNNQQWASVYRTG